MNLRVLVDAEAPSASVVIEVWTDTGRTACVPLDPMEARAFASRVERAAAVAARASRVTEEARTSLTGAK